MATKDYKEASAIARKRRAANIAAFYKTPTWKEEELPKNLTQFALTSGYYTDAELAIIQSEADAILENVKTRKWTALEVAQAFCKASALAQELVLPVSPRSDQGLSTHDSADKLRDRGPLS